MNTTKISLSEVCYKEIEYQLFFEQGGFESFESIEHYRNEISKSNELNNFNLKIEKLGKGVNQYYLEIKQPN
jgi:hypothetical protein